MFSTIFWSHVRVRKSYTEADFEVVEFDIIRHDCSGSTRLNKKTIIQIQLRSEQFFFYNNRYSSLFIRTKTVLDSIEVSFF